METSKRNSGNQRNLRSLVSLKDCPNKVPQESQIVTERRNDAKLIIKLKNDIDLLHELLEEEQDKNKDMHVQLAQYEEMLSATDSHERDLSAL